MSIELFEKQQALLDLYRKLGEAEVESMAGVPVISHEELMTKLRKMISVY
jgi:hypothetical protein